MLARGKENPLVKRKSALSNLCPFQLKVCQRHRARETANKKESGQRTEKEAEKEKSAVVRASERDDGERLTGKGRYEENVGHDPEN